MVIYRATSQSEEDCCWNKTQMRDLRKFKKIQKTNKFNLSNAISVIMHLLKR